MRNRLPSLAVTLAALALAPAAARADEPSADPAADALASELRTPRTGLASLKLYGFADFSYAQWLIDERSSWWPIMPHAGAFSVGNLNLYLDAQLGPHARSLVEVRFTYLPNGTVASMNPDNPAQLVLNGTTGVRDYTRAGLDLTAWGGIVIERALVEWTFSEALTLRAGQFLTPYGIWNVDHGSPAIVGFQRPYVINAKVMPEHQVGLEAYGTRWLGSARVGYHVTFSNGRYESDPLQFQSAMAGQDPASVPQYVKYDGKFGVGGRLFVEGDWAGELRVGVSGYTGRFTKKVTGLDFSTGSPVPFESTPVQYDESVFAADAQWRIGPVLAQAEWLWQRFTNTAASSWSGSGGRDGGYLLLGYRLPLEILPFVTVQYYDQDQTSRPTYVVYGVEGGVNVHLLPNLVLKASYSYYDMPHAPEGSVYTSPLRLVASQLAWAF